MKFSFIICSRNKELLSDLTENIKKTVGDIDYEMVPVDNSENEYNIFTAYNKGVELARGEILCFLHEDIMFRSNDWGEDIYSHFVADASVGMVGMIGSQYFPATPSSFFIVPQRRYIASGALFQHLTDERQLKDAAGCKIRVDYHNFDNREYSQVVILDGLFFCIRRDLFDKGLIRFDDVTFDGFHFYDIDISLQVHRNAKVMVTHNLIMDHFSQGSLTIDWFYAAFRLYNKWKDILPLDISSLNENPLMREHSCMFRFFEEASKRGYFNDPEFASLCDNLLREKKGKKTKYYIRAKNVRKYGCETFRYKLGYRLDRMINQITFGKL